MSTINKDVNNQVLVGFSIVISRIDMIMFIISHKKADDRTN